MKNETSSKEYRVERRQRHWSRPFLLSETFIAHCRITILKQTSNARRYDSLDPRLNTIETLFSLNLANQIIQFGYWSLRYSRPSNLPKWLSRRKMGFYRLFTVETTMFWPKLSICPSRVKWNKIMSILFSSTCTSYKFSFTLEKILKNSVNIRSQTHLRIVRIHRTSRGTRIRNRSWVINSFTSFVSNRGWTFIVSYSSKYVAAHFQRV